VATYPTVSLGRLCLRFFHLAGWNFFDNLTRGVPFQSRLPSHTVFTDASMEGWGVVFQDRSFQGKWIRETHHINWLELRTVLTALHLLQFELRGKTVLFLIDNTTSVAYLNKQGGLARRHCYVSQ